MSVIVRFPSIVARERFLSRAQLVWPELIRKTYLAKRNPDTVIEQLAEEEIPRLKSLVQDCGNGNIFADVQFEPLKPL